MRHCSWGLKSLSVRSSFLFLVGEFVLWYASIPHWLRKDGITVLVIEDEEVIHASVGGRNELPHLVRLH